MILLKCLYSQGPWEKEFLAQINSEDLDRSYTKWKELFDNNDFWPLSKEAFQEIFIALRDTGLYLSKPYSIKLLDFK